MGNDIMINLQGLKERAMENVTSLFEKCILEKVGFFYLIIPDPIS